MGQAMASDPKCSDVRTDGQPCGGTALADGKCFAHSETTAAARAEAKRRGGRNSATVVRLRGLMPPRLVPIFDHLETALADVLAGSLDPRQATAAAAVARAMVSVLTAGELEERVRRLEGGQER
jgi:hypothetical protein